LPLISAAHVIDVLYRDRRLTPRLLHAVLVLVASSVACLLTPYGTDILSTSVTMLSEAGYRSTIPEWSPTTPQLVLQASPASFIVAGLLVAGVALAGRRQSPWDLGLVVLSVGIAASGVRFLPYLCLLGLGPAASGLGRAARVLRGHIGMALAGAASAVGLGYALLSPLPQPHLGWQRHRYPDPALQFVRNNAIEGRVLNSFGHGGYLIYHAFGEYPVYVDGRNDIVYPLPLLTRAVRVLQDPKLFEQEYAKWGFEWLFIDNSPDATRRAHLDANPNWTLVFASEPALVYVRSDGTNRKVAESHGYRILNAHALGESLRQALTSPDPTLREAARREALRMVRQDPQSYPANVALALAYQFSGRQFADRAGRQWQRVAELEAGR
jgi:hypothetical protein